jgi:predicted RND superfamily exporter protein
VIADLPRIQGGHMLKLVIIRIVDVCTRHPLWVVVLALALSAASAVYAERHFAVKTDINELISPDLPWARRVTQFVDAFPQREILAVIDAPTPELVDQAATKSGRLLKRGRIFCLLFASRKAAAFSSAMDCCTCQLMR